MKEYDAYIFDLDGTLLDTLPDLVVLTNGVLVEEGYNPCSQDEIHRFVGDGVEALLRRCVIAGGQSPHDEGITKLMVQWRVQYQEYGSPLTKPYPYIEELLDELSLLGKKLAVLTNKFDAGAQDIITQFFGGTFSIVHGECSDIPRKPDPAGLIRTFNELEVEPANAVYIGDSPNDVLVSKRAGIDSIAVAWGYHPKEEFESLGIKPIVDSAFEILPPKKSEYR